MGSSLTAKCPCGFSSGDLLVGGGMANFQTYCGAPALCEHCRSIQVANYLEERPVCRTCGGAIMFYDSPTLRRKPRRISSKTRLVFSWGLKRGTFQLPDSEYHCPKCGEVTMRFFEGGICWD